MHTGKFVFAQLMELLPWRRFETCVRRYDGDRKVHAFSCADHFRVLAFAQFTYRESLRDIEACLRAVAHKWHHLGLRGDLSRNNLAHANRQRDWRIYADFAQLLIDEARSLYAHEPLDVDLEATVYALDSTTIDLCLSMFPWARFRRRKGAIKLHTLLDLRGSIPEFIAISTGKTHDVNLLDQLVPLPGAYYVMDRAYLDFERLYTLQQAKAFFVTRARKNFVYHRQATRPVDKTSGVKADQVIRLKSFYQAQAYPEPLRRIRFYDATRNRHLVFLTNHLELPPTTIAALYKSRWHIELFFKWIKQHLRIKAFYGTSQNAVKTQIWVAVSVYLLVAIAKKRLGVSMSLHAMLQVISLSMFEKIPLNELFLQPEPRNPPPTSPNQLLLFD